MGCRGKGTGMDQKPARTSSTGGSTLFAQASFCTRPVIVMDWSSLMPGTDPGCPPLSVAAVADPGTGATSSPGEP
ncbi:hypothetical protein ACFFX0_20500 [Citricoccus parietis]|uniref:Uncharacterized protein n=1 Tax=Citricoccus parietis TaxID=592307 RepID=A0ABV5G3E3_9MICC